MFEKPVDEYLKKKESYCILFFEKKETNVIVLILRKCLKHFNNVS